MLKLNQKAQLLEKAGGRRHITHNERLMVALMEDGKIRAYGTPACWLWIHKDFRK
jgi:hypothetical protein